jgi:hypothetical protein
MTLGAKYRKVKALFSPFRFLSDALSTTPSSLRRKLNRLSVFGAWAAGERADGCGVLCFIDRSIEHLAPR